MFWLWILVSLWLALGVAMLIVGREIFDKGVANLAERSFLDQRTIVALTALVVLALAPIILVVVFPSVVKESLDESRSEQSHDGQNHP